MFETRFLSKIVSDLKVETRADGKSVISGYAARFYDPKNPGTQYELWGGTFERIMPGAFDEVLKDTDTRALFNHQSEYVLGRTKSGTLTLAVDSLGLKYSINPPDTHFAKDLIVSLNRNDIDGSSFSFSIVGRGGKNGRVLWAQEGETEIREIHSIGELRDVGPVTFPAYTATTAGARSVDGLKEEREQYRLDLQRARDEDAAEHDAIQMRLRMLDFDTFRWN